MEQKSNYLYFVGVDISKDTLDCTLMKGHVPQLHQKIFNQPDDIRAFATAVLKTKGITRRNLVFGMENTGYYTSPLVQALSGLRIKYVSEHALNIKRSLGMVRGKSDRIDSQRIAMHLYRCRDLLSPSLPRRPEIEKLAMLSSMRERFIRLELQVKNPLRQSKGFLSKELQSTAKLLSAASGQAISSDIRNLDLEIRRTWSSDPELSRLMRIMLSVPSVGEVTAVQVLVTTNEFRNIFQAKKFACYCGVAPFPHSSGTALEKGARTSKMCNKRMKGLIRTCAVSASIHVPDIREYYLRKQAEGKHKMSVLNAIGFKVISRIFTCVRQDRMYKRDYFGELTKPMATNPIPIEESAK